MWAMAVVVPGVAAKNTFEMAGVHDQDVVEALEPNGPHESLGVGVRVGVRKGVLRIWAPSARKTSSKPATYFVLRSRSRNFTSIPSSTMSPVTFLACWVTQAAWGWAVTPVIQTRRRPSSMKNRT